MYTRTHSVDSARCPQLKHVHNMRHCLPPSATGVPWDFPSSPPNLLFRIFYLRIQHKHLPTFPVQKSRNCFISSTLATSIEKESLLNLLILPPKFYLSPIFSPLQFSSGTHNNFQLPGISS